jgi:hypothetical protein
MEMTQQNFTPQTQKERWLKYGANVAFTILVVIVLAFLLAYMGQRFDRRIDTTTTGIYSLKPQTINLISNQNQHIKLVSLYSPKDAQGKENPYAGPVRALLEEYSRKGKNIEFDVIDPVTQPTKTDSLISEAVSKYGGAVKAYKDFLQDFDSKTFDQLKQLTAAEAAAVANFQTDNLGQDQRGQDIAAIIATVRDQLPKMLTQLKDQTSRELRKKFPDYKAAVDQIKDTLGTTSQAEAAIGKLAIQYKDDAKVPDPIRQYLSDSLEHHDAIKKLADATTKKIDTLGELKVGELQDAVKQPNVILVLGDKDWRVINVDQVWVSDTRDLQGYTEGQQIKPRFAGEQAITTAILSITSGAKPKVVFIRAGGGPLTNPGFPPFQAGGPLSNVADRLRSYNFDVLEKDITGTYAMQAQMQGQQVEPEPSDADIKDAVWVVIDQPADQRQGPAPSVAPKLIEHLMNGGSAMVLALPSSENLSDALKPYGLDLVSDAVIVHEVPKGEHPQTGDLASDAQWLPFVFLINKYGDHMLAKPLESLDFLIAAGVPVRTNPTPGVTQSQLLPIPNNPQTWGERDLESANDNSVKYDPGTDVPPPLFTGATAEKANSRVVVFGCLQSFLNRVVAVPDQEMLKRGVVVARFPGNTELFANAVFWLAKMDSMIAISPAAMEVSRISNMSDATLNGWRVGVVLIILPGLVLAAGITMYFARRD